MTTKARPHDDPKCICPGCYTWDVLASSAPITRCGETHVHETDLPCQHGYTRWCPSFGIKPGQLNPLTPAP